MIVDRAYDPTNRSLWRLCFKNVSWKSSTAKDRPGICSGGRMKSAVAVPLIATSSVGSSRSAISGIVSTESLSGCTIAGTSFGWASNWSVTAGVGLGVGDGDPDGDALGDGEELGVGDADGRIDGDGVGDALNEFTWMMQL
jgi:hypothetical protein